MSIKAEFWGGPWNGKTIWLQSATSHVAVCRVPEPDLFAPPESNFVEYTCVLRLDSLAVYIHSDHQTKMLEALFQFSKSWSRTYMLWCESELMISIGNSLTLQAALYNASEDFMDSINRIAARRIDARAKRPKKSA
jgi:hypothetical protein